MKKLTLCLLVLSLVFITGCENKRDLSSYIGTNPYSETGDNNNSNNNNSAITPAALNAKVESTGAMTERQKLVVFVKNNNNVAVDIETEVEFYDSSEKLVGSDTERMYAVGANSEVAYEVWSTPESFDHYKIYNDVEVSDDKSYFDKVEIQHNNTGKEITVQVTNNSSDEIDNIEVSVVYYLNGTVVGFDYESEWDVKAGRNANFTLDYPYNKNYKNVLWDTYKVFLNQAYSY